MKNKPLKLLKASKKNITTKGFLKVFFILSLFTLIILFPSDLANKRFTPNIFPNLTHVMGTDSIGRDILFRVIVGSKLTILIALLGAFMELVIGSLYGILLAISSKCFKIIITSVLDILTSIPYLLIVTLLVMAFNNSFIGILIAITSTGWLSTARIVRGETLKLLKENYVISSYLMGRSSIYITRKHIFPNLRGILVTSAILGVPKYIFTECFLSFLGFGFAYPHLTLGMIITEAQGNFYFYPYQSLLPSMVLVITLLALTRYGDKLKIKNKDIRWRGIYG